MKLNYQIILLFFWGTFQCTFTAAQTTSFSNPVLQKAHEKKVDLSSFQKTRNQQFLIKIYKVEKSTKGKTHHWFLQLTDIKGMPLNYANIRLDGYLKTKSNIKFKYQGGVFPLCTQGKYVIGFVKVQEAGIYVLDIIINNFDEQDKISYEIEI